MSERPQWGVRLARGVVTYLNDDPLVTWEQAVQAREKIEQITGEWGEVEKVYVLPLSPVVSVDGPEGERSKHGSR